MVRFSQKEIYGKRRFAQYEISVARGKVKGSLGLRSKSEEGIFLLIRDQQGDSWSLPAMNVLDFCKAVIREADSRREILENYVKRRSMGSFVLVAHVRLDSVVSLDLARFVIGILAGLDVDSIGMRSYVSRGKALMESWRNIEKKMRKLAKQRTVRVKEADSALSENELVAIAEGNYSLIRNIEKVATPRALLHDLEFIEAKLAEGESLETEEP